MAELSQTLKNFVLEFERQILPHLNKGPSHALGAGQLITCYVSAATLQDPQLRELLGITAGEATGRFMNVSVVAKPDMTFETYYGDDDAS